MVTNNFFYTTSTSDDFVYSTEDWEKTHSPYDGKPWWGIVPPPTYYDLKNMKTNTTTTLDNTISVGYSYKIINVNVQKLYDENNELKEKIKSLESELYYWKTNYAGSIPEKYRRDFEKAKDILNKIEEGIKKRA